MEADGKEYMVARCSRSLNKHEKNYASYYGEMLAVVYGSKTFRHYLQGNKFTLVTDHSPLTWLMNSQPYTNRPARQVGPVYARF